MNTAQLRKMIFAGCKAAGMDDDTRHQWQKTLTGKASLTGMRLDDLETLAADLRAKGLLTPPRQGRRNPVWGWVDQAVPERRPLLRKIIMQTQVAGIPYGQQKRYVEGIAVQMLGQQADTRLEICGPERLRQIVQAMAIHLQRHPSPDSSPSPDKGRAGEGLGAEGTV